MMRMPCRLLRDLSGPSRQACEGRFAATFRSWSLAASADSLPPNSAASAEASDQSSTPDGAVDVEATQEASAGENAPVSVQDQQTQQKSGAKDWLTEHTREEEAEITKVLDADISQLQSTGKPSTPDELRKTVLALQSQLIEWQYEDQQAGKEPEMPVFVLSEEEEGLTLNFAGEGQPGWRVAAYDEKMMATYWECDIIGGAVHRNELNAQLCEESKQLMYDWHKHWGWSESDLAIYFRIRQQRVMAIIALKELEKADEEKLGKPLNPDIHYAMNGGPGLRDDGEDGFEGIWESDQVAGTGERHVKMLPRSPTYEWGNDMDPDKRKQAEDAHRRNVDTEVLEEKLAFEEDAQMIQEFKERLDFNLGRTGKEVKRDSRKQAAPKRPKEGYSLAVQTLDHQDQDGHAKTYVAPPGGGRRSLTPSEQVYRNRQKPKPRRRML